jgi:ribosome-associated translation inhibitor RaiA
MIIQFNTDHNLQGSEKVISFLKELIEEQLNRYEDHITRIEVHLSNEKGAKEGASKIRCLLEARVERRQPVAFTNSANNYQQAVAGATEKLISSLDKMANRLKQQLKG